MSFERPPEIEMIRAETRKFSDAAHRAGKFGQIPDNGQNLFTLHTANDWIALEQHSPPPQMLFGDFWYQGELCILFADANAGKSILAVQIGNGIAGGQPIGPFATHARNAKVLYVDFELTAKQFQTRYFSEYGAGFRFHNHFYRAQFDASATLPFNYKTFDDYISAGLNQQIKGTNATVLIIDNISCVRNGTEHISGAIPVMKQLKALKTKYNLSVLVLAHTPKRNPTRPLSANDLHGSKMLINFADSAFAIGTSTTNKTQRYIKQIKQRSGPQVFGEENVILCHITKPGNCLQFEFTEFGHERDHLRSPTSAARNELAQKAAELSATGLSQRQISRELNVSLGYVNKLLK
jgi:hypothetical protein